MTTITENLENIMAQNSGVLPVLPSFVARDFLPPGFRLGLRKHDYYVEERGFICERWFVSTTKADNDKGPDDEGLSYIDGSSVQAPKILLKNAIKEAGVTIFGENHATEYASDMEEGTMGRLLKLFDFGDVIPHHIHQEQHILDKMGEGKRSKNEAYYFPHADPGGRPETNFGYDHEMVRTGAAQQWLEHYVNEMVAGDIHGIDHGLRFAPKHMMHEGTGLYLPSGMPHAPGTRLTFEAQQDSDVFAMILKKLRLTQRKVDPSLLTKDIPQDVLETAYHGSVSAAVLDQINWDLAGDERFMEKYNIVEEPRGEPQQGGKEVWVFYNKPVDFEDGPDFSGTRVRVKPGQSFEMTDEGAYTVYVSKGEGLFNGGYEMKGTGTDVGDHLKDEFLVPHKTATGKVMVQNTSESETLEFFKVFGRGINKKDVPVIPLYKMAI